MLLTLAAGCVPGTGLLTVPETPPITTPDPITTTMVTTIPAPDPTVDSGTPQPTADTGLACADVPTLPLSMDRLSEVLPSEEFTFDDTGWLFNLPDGRNAVYRTLYDAPTELFAPFSSFEVAGVRVLHDGGLAVANEASGAVERVDLVSGARTVIVGGINQPNSLAVDEAGRLYVASFAEIIRVDPVTSEVEELLELPGSDLDGLTFAPNEERLYFNHDDGGRIGYLELDDDGEVTGSGVLATIALDGYGFTELDGMATDVCGNLYVTSTNGEIHRVDPEGNVTSYADPQGAWTTSLHFGSGVGGWERDHLYVMDRSEGILDIDAGVEGN